VAKIEYPHGHPPNFVTDSSGELRCTRTWVLGVIIGGFVVDLSEESLDAPAHGVRVVYVDVVVFSIRRLLHERLADLLPYKVESSCLSI